MRIGSRSYLVIVAVVGAVSCGAVAAQDFRFAASNVNGRQIFETRMGATTRTPPSGIERAGFVSTVLTAGPTAGTTTIAGALLDGGTLFSGGPPPTYTTILASGSAFSLGGGCRQGNFTLFPFINANRPQVARYDATTGAFGLVTPTIPGNDQFDAIDCATIGSGVLYITSNNTDDSLELYRDNGSGFALLQTVAAGTLETPFGGGLRPSIAIERLNGDAFADIAYMTSDGATRSAQVDTNTGAVSGQCVVASSTPATAFTKPREMFVVLFIGNPGKRAVTADFNLDGFADIAVVTTAGCVVQTTNGPAGSANGGGGYNWNGYGGAQTSASGLANVMWGDYYYIRPQQTFAVDAALTSPFAGRGGPFDGGPVVDSNLGDSYLVAGIGPTNTQIQHAMPQRQVPGEDVIHSDSLEIFFATWLRFGK